MNRTFLLPAAWLLDQIAGDPEWIPHPVRLMGLAITRGESAMRRKNQSNGTELITGAALTIAVVASSYYLSRQAICFANRQSPPSNCSWAGRASQPEASSKRRRV